MCPSCLSPFPALKIGRWIFSVIDLERFLYQEVFQGIYHRWGMLDVVFLAFRLKIDRFVSKSGDHLTIAVGALVSSTRSLPFLP